MSAENGSTAVEREKAPVKITAVEYQQLLRCVRRGLAPANEPPISVAAELNWPLLLALAREHRVVTLVNKGLQGADGVPAAARRWMEDYCRTSVSHNLSLASELIEVMTELDQGGIAAVPFKGPVWAKMLYGNLADREIADLDLFVEPSAVEQATKIASDRGYISAAVNGIPLDETKDIQLIHPQTGLHLELHWSACEPWRDARLARVKLWEPQATSVLLNRAMPVPSPENMLSLLAIHGFRDGWESLKWLCDISAAVRAFPDLDFAKFLREAGRRSRRRLVLVPMALAQRLLDLRLPPALARAIARDTMVTEIAAQIERRFYTAEAAHLQSDSKTVGGRMYLEWYRVQMCDSVWERLSWHAKFVMGLLEPNEHDRSRFGGKLPAGFYWLVRPWRLMRSFGLSKTLRMARQFVGRCVPPGLRNSS